MTIKIEFEPQLLVHTTEQQIQEDLLFSSTFDFDEDRLLEFFEQQASAAEEEDDDDEVSTLLNSLLDDDDDSTINSQELSCLHDDYNDDDYIHTLDCSWNDIDFPTRRRNGSSTHCGLRRNGSSRRPSNERLEELRRQIDFDRFLLDGIELQENTEHGVERSDYDADIAVTEEECEEDDGFPKDSVRLGQRRLPGASCDQARHLSNIIDIPKPLKQLNDADNDNDDADNDNDECYIDICCYLNDIVDIEDDVKSCINHSM